MKTGLKIQIKRIELNKRQYELAKEVGISTQYLRLIESDRATNPSKTIMEKISKALNSNVSELFFDEEV